MKPVYQTTFGYPNGNCFQAALASILELPLEKVPHFMLDLTNDWFMELRNWLGQFGLDAICVRGESEAFLPSKGYYIMGGRRPGRTYLHAVVACNGQVVHDPLPEGQGVLEPPYDYILFIDRLKQGVKWENTSK